ncbi:MAG: lipopolysaccharide biosynthesis protein [Planctomycetaceae bacterium]|nr:lipopolysaccharide biosynthesis protein [Planctomycetaceae bacterium]
MDDLKQKTTRALKWRFANVFGQVAIQLVVTCILARLLPIEAFGLIGMAMVFMGLVTVFSEVGMAPVLIQRESISAEEIAHAYTISVLLGCLWAGCLFAIAPWIAAWFQAPALIPIIQILSLTFLFSGLTLTTLATLQRELNFHRIFWIELFSYLVGYGIVGITLAFQGAGAWSLAYALLARSALQLVTAFVLARRWPSFGFRWSVARKLLGQGAGFSAVRMVLFAARNVDALLIGRLLGTDALGLYNRSFQLSTVPATKLSGVLNTVLFPAYSRIQNDRVRLKTLFLGNLNSVVLVLFPMLAFLSVTGREVITLLLGEKWEGAIFPFQMLCLGAMPLIVINICEILAQSCGSIRGSLARHGIYLAGISMTVFYLIPYGLPAVAMGVSGLLVVQWLLMGHLVVGLLICKLQEFFAAHIPGVMLAVCTGLSTISIRGLMINELGIASAERTVLGAASIFIPFYLIALAVIPDRYLSKQAIQVRTQIKRAIRKTIDANIICTAPVSIRRIYTKTMTMLKWK